ncbi:oligosaccharide flippase family protein [Mesorhizobium sp. BE184]|uniref:oligosaccharide flippase family protein n=1 Tax=Mesorhizobium sp. BE184 TaxID=2817714 RepID=UPI0028552F3A|nr:oligosaccharide flippase family protein [Mesorhizobium sp. BE184]MDR7033313.1 O-antigen/teichoic acid export membrane protein [Mesorhizobium sp. BE184]
MTKGIMSNSIVNAAAGMLLLVTGFCCSVIVARLLGPEANGTIAFALWIAATGSLIAELGTGILLMRLLPQLKTAGLDHDRRRAFAAYLAYPVLAATLLLAVVYVGIFQAPRAAEWIKSTTHVVILTGVLLLVQSLGSFAKNYLIGEQRLGTFFRLTLIGSILQLAVVLGGAMTYGVLGALFGYVVGQAVLFAYTLRILTTPPRSAGHDARLLAGTSAVLFIEYLISAVFLTRPELFFLQHFRAVEEVGFYAVALSLANLALQLPIQLTGSLIPFYSEKRGAENGTVPAETFSGVIRSFAYITLPMCFGLAAIAQPLVVAVYGPQFAPAGLVVAILALGSPAYVFIQLMTQYLYSMDRVGYRLMVSGIGALIMVAGCLLAVPLWGGAGASAVRGLVFLVMGLLLLRHVRLTGGHEASGAVVTKIVLAALACGAVAFFMTKVTAGVAGIALGVVAGAIAYAVMLRLLATVPPQDAAVLDRMLNRLPRGVRKAFQPLVRLIVPLNSSRQAAE